MKAATATPVTEKIFQAPLICNLNSTANLAGITLSTPSLATWIIDTGATNHMCSSLGFFKKISLLIIHIQSVLEYSYHMVRAIVSITHVGTVIFL